MTESVSRLPSQFRKQGQSKQQPLRGKIFNVFGKGGEPYMGVLENPLETMYWKLTRGGKCVIHKNRVYIYILFVCLCATADIAMLPLNFLLRMKSFCSLILEFYSKKLKRNLWLTPNRDIRRKKIKCNFLCHFAAC